MVKIAASILAADFTKLPEQVGMVERAGIDWHHMDVMDGHFVPNLSFGPFIIKQVDAITNYTLDVHLMISNPEKYLEVYAAAGADLITVHGEVIGKDPTLLKKIREIGLKSGMSLNPDAPVEDFFPLFEHLDLFLVMSVHAGFGGQAFMPQVLEKVRRAVEWRQKYGYNYLISIDGGINAETARLAKEAGVDVLVCGTALYHAEEINQFVKSLKS